MCDVKWLQLKCQVSGCLHCDVLWRCYMCYYYYAFSYIAFLQQTWGMVMLREQSSGIWHHADRYMVTDILELTVSNFRVVFLHATSVHENYLTNLGLGRLLWRQAVRFSRMSVTIYINLQYPYTETMKSSFSLLYYMSRSFYSDRIQ